MASAEEPAGGGRGGLRPTSQANIFADSFRIRTVEDFGSRIRKRDLLDSRSACQRCRTRKSRCTIESSQANTRSPGSGSTRCLQCRRADADCRWDKTDRRKRLKSSSIAPSGTVGRSLEEECVPHHAPLQQAGCNGSLLQMPFQAPPIQPPGASQSDVTLERSAVETLGDQGPAISSVGQLSTADVRLPSQGQLGAAQQNPAPQLGDGGMHGANKEDQGELVHFESPPTSHLQPLDAAVFSDTWQLDPNSATPDWQGLQDFVLGLDFQEMAGEFPVLMNRPYSQAQAGTAQNPSKPGEKAVPRVIRLRYYRRFGPTAVAPGLRSLSLVVERGDPEQSSVYNEAQSSGRSSSHPLTASTPNSVASDKSHIFDSTSGLPHADLLPQILDTFFEHFGGHFPFLHPLILGGHVKSGEASSFLLNTIAALAVRFCTFSGPVAEALNKYEHAWQRGAIFLRPAKEQLVPLLSIPAPEVVAGLLILAWAEYGDDNETGMWMFLGMAIRMAQDLGLHRTPEASVSDPHAHFHDLARPNPDGSLVMTDEQSCIHQQTARMVMFWSVFIADVCVSLCTGRPTTIRRSEIEVAIPTVADMKIAQLDYSKEASTANLILPETARVMLDVAEAVDTLNERGPAAGEGFLETVRIRDRRLAELKRILLSSYERLPSSVCFNAHNYAAASTSAQHGLFVLLHLYFYTIVALLSTTGSHITQPSSGLEQGQGREPTTTTTDPRNGAVANDYREAMMISQSTVQVLTVADLVNRKGFLATPFINHCLFVTASMLLLGGRPPQLQTQTETSPLEIPPHNIASGRSSGQQNKTSHQIQPQARSAQDHNQEGGYGAQNNGSGSLETLVMHSSYEFLREKLQDQAEYYGAVNTVLGALKTKVKGMTGTDNLEDMGTVESSSSNRPVEVRDPGIVTRYTIIE